jgi:hypothetical protein
MKIELKNMKPISYYENQIIAATEKIKATNEFLREATTESQISFGNKMNKFLLKEVYHNREIVMYLRSINKLMQPLLN